MPYSCEKQGNIVHPTGQTAWQSGSLWHTNSVKRVQYRSTMTQMAPDTRQQTVKQADSTEKGKQITAYYTRPGRGINGIQLHGRQVPADRQTASMAYNYMAGRCRQTASMAYNYQTTGINMAPTYPFA